MSQSTIDVLRRILLSSLSLPRDDPAYMRTYKRIDYWLPRLPEPDLARIERELQIILDEIQDLMARESSSGNSAGSPPIAMMYKAPPLFLYV